MDAPADVIMRNLKTNGADHKDTCFYCYSEESRVPTPGMLACQKCNKTYHKDCITIIKAWKIKSIPEDHFFKYTCKSCHCPELLERCHISIGDIAHLALFNLTCTVPHQKVSAMPKYYYFSEIVAFVQLNWASIGNYLDASNWHKDVRDALEEFCIMDKKTEGLKYLIIRLVGT